MQQDTDKPETLGDKLYEPRGEVPAGREFLDVLALILGAVFWWIFASFIVAVAASALCRIVLRARTPVRMRQGRWRPPHFLFRGDQQRFMKGLKLSDKTVLFDGSNIYHFGLDNGVGRKALTSLVQELRAEGYRIVCFFDANIYFTLAENAEFQRSRQKFSIEILQKIFGLQRDEIYVVPSGNQADRYVLETLSHMPISFAVTNDRFRDYAARYDFLTKDNDWRKGVSMKDGTLSLYKHKFQTPLLM